MSRRSLLSCVVGLLAVGLVTVTPGVTQAAGAAPEVADPAGTTRTTATTTAQTSYLAVAASGTTRRLQLVSKTSGKVLRTVATAKTVSEQEPFVDADLAPNGTIWAVVRTGASPYDVVLRRYTATTVKTVRQYVTSARVSADNATLATTVLSPDGDGDGQGLAALRLMSTRTLAVTRTLWSTQFPVGDRGWPTVEIGGMQVNGWLSRDRLVVGDGCCDSASVFLVPARTASKATSWPAFSGDHNTIALGTFGTTGVLVTRVRETSTWQRLGIDAFRMTVAKPAGVYLTGVKGDVEALSVVDRLVAATKATPLRIGPKRFPYTGPGTVKYAFL